MKRKLFSAILFGAFLTASTSGLTSCKDYDDDISNLQSQIDKLATAEQLSTKVSELQTAIAQAKSDAIDAANAAKQVADNALKAAQDAATKGDVEAAKAAADAAQKTVDDLKASGVSAAAINAAQEAADKANAAIAEAIEKGTPVIEGLNKAIEDLKAAEEEHTKAINDLDKQLNGEGGIAERLAAAEKAIEEGANIDLTELTKLIEDFEAEAKEILGTALVMVTDVDLFVSNADEFDNYDTDLNFWKVKELADVTFPGDKETGEDTFTFTKDNVRLFNDKLIVRVSPVDATLTPEMISLINSQGAEVSKDIVEITSVEPYEELLTTRGASNNGLWTVNFKVADNKQDELNALAWTKKNDVDKQVVFAVAVNNTQDVADTRRVVSEYAVTMNAKDPGAYKFNANDIKIKGTALADIHNRITKTEQNQSIPADVKEYTWKNGVSLDIITSGNDKNVTEASATPTGDYRQDEDILVVELGEKISIDFNADNKPIRGFYVTTDYKRAVESGNTEINAWNSYKYENVGTFKNDGTQLVAAKLQEGNHGEIKVLDLAAMTLVGDVIGFRVFAINLDGTLVDPDGFAFYVGIGASSQADSKELPAAKATIKYSAANAGVSRPLTFADKDQNTTDLVDATSVMGVDFDKIEWSCSKQRENTSNAKTPVYGTDFTVLYLQDDGTTYNTSDVKKKFKIQILQPTMFEDNATSTITAKLYKEITGGGKYLVRTITMPLKKVMPTEVPENVTYNALQDKYLLMNASAWNGVTLNRSGDNTAAVDGKFDLSKFLVYADDDNTKIGSIDDQANYTYLLGNSATDNNGKYTKELSIASPYNTTSIARKLIDGKTEHSIRAKFVYEGISLVWDSDANNWKASNELELFADQEPTVVYCSWSMQAADFTTFAPTRLRKGAGTQQDPYTYKNKSFIVWKGKNGVVGDRDCSGLINVRAKFGFKAQFATNSFRYSNAQGENNLWGLVENGYLKIADAWTEANGVKNAYFKPEVSNGTITQIKQVAETAPDHEEVFVFKVVDCFNYKSEIRIPISIVSARPDFTGWTDVTFK